MAKLKQYDCGFEQGQVNVIRTINCSSFIVNISNIFNLYEAYPPSICSSLTSSEPRNLSNLCNFELSLKSYHLLSRFRSDCPFLYPKPLVSLQVQALSTLQAGAWGNFVSVPLVDSGVLLSPVAASAVQLRPALGNISSVGSWGGLGPGAGRWPLAG